MRKRTKFPWESAGERILKIDLRLSMSMSMSLAIFSVAQIVKLLQSPRHRIWSLVRTKMSIKHGEGFT